MVGNLYVEGGECSISGSDHANEDYSYVVGKKGACLADGMGGERMGATVARCACGAAARALEAGASAHEAVERAQRFARELVDNLDCGRPGSSLTVVRCEGGSAQVAWAGDVACMHLDSRQGTLRSLTRPDRGATGVTNALGRKTISINTMSCELNEEDRLLLCSDGIWDEMEHEEIRRALVSAQTPREAAVNLAMGQEHIDDATAVVLFVRR